MGSKRFTVRSRQKAIGKNNTAYCLPLTDNCRGNVFLAIFGAVAMVGVLGAGVMNFSQGPVQNAITLNKKNSSDVDMAMVGQLAIMSATSATNKGDCDNDSYVEPPEFRDAGANPKPGGGGYVPNSIGAAKKDPWGTEYGYCVWDAGPVTLNAACQGTSGTDKRLQGSDSKIYPVIAVISAGPDGVFTTTCRNFSTGAARADQNNDGDLDDVGDFQLVTKAAVTDDDIIVTYSYEGAMASSGGLWKIKSSDSNTAYLNKKIEAQAATIVGTGTFERIAAIGGDFVDIISGLKLADPLVMTACNLANTSVLRRALSGYGVEMCSGTAWTSVGGGGGGGGGGTVAAINDLYDGVIASTNVFGGLDVGNAALTGTKNTGFGVRNLKNLTTGSNNSAFGYEAMTNATDAHHNTAMGWRAGNKITSGTRNTAFGYEALMTCTSCSGNTAIGFQSGKMLTTAIENTSAGSLSMLSNTTGSGNSVIGFEALKSAAAPASNVVAGWNAGKFATTATSNVLIGSQSAGDPTATYRSQNVAIGTETMKTGGDMRDNVAVGTYSLRYAYGWNNVGIGYEALSGANSNNVAVGASSMNGTGLEQTTGVGYLALAAATGARNTAIGNYGLYSLTTGTDNTAVGYNAIYAGGDATQNTAAGSGAMRALTSGSAGNTAAGKDSMMGTGLKSYNTAIGFEALKAGTDMTRNTAVGYQAGVTMTTGNYNTAIGFMALQNNIVGSSNTAIGYMAARGVTSSDVTVIGAQANSTYDIAAGSVYAGAATYPATAAAALNTVVGTLVMSTSAANANNVIAGVSAGLSPGTGNVAIGQTALQGTGATGNVAIGRQALQSATASNNTVIGPNSAVSATTPTKLTTFGNANVSATNPGNDNTLFGYLAGQYLTGASNTAFGVGTVRGTGSKDSNTALGYFALNFLTTGNNNTAAGYFTLSDTTTGANNTVIGRNANGGATGNGITIVASNPSITANLSNITAIGYQAAVTASNTIRFGNTAITNISGQVAFTATSDKRVKKDIHPSDLGLDFIMKLQPVSYRLIAGNGRLDYGFIAQDIEKALEGRKTNLITRENNTDRTYKMRGDDLLSPIVKAVQEQQQALESLEKELDSMR